MQPNAKSGKVGYRALFRNTAFRLLFISGFISQMGDWFNEFACIVLIQNLTDSTLVTSGYMTSRVVGVFLFSGLAGVYIDKYNKVKILVLCDLVRALLALGYLLVGSEESLWIVFVLPAINGAFAATFEPCRTAILPLILGRGNVKFGNTLDGISFSLTQAVGSSTGGLITAMLGTSTVFYINSASYFVSMLLILLLFREKELMSAILRRDKRSKETVFEDLSINSLEDMHPDLSPELNPATPDTVVDALLDVQEIDNIDKIDKIDDFDKLASTRNEHCGVHGTQQGEKAQAREDGEAIAADTVTFDNSDKRDSSRGGTLGESERNIAGHSNHDDDDDDESGRSAPGGPKAPLGSKAGASLVSEADESINSCVEVGRVSKAAGAARVRGKREGVAVAGVDRAHEAKHVADVGVDAEHASSVGIDSGDQGEHAASVSAHEEILVTSAVRELVGNDEPQSRSDAAAVCVVVESSGSVCLGVSHKQGHSEDGGSKSEGKLALDDEKEIQVGFGSFVDGLRYFWIARDLLWVTLFKCLLNISMAAFDIISTEFSEHRFAFGFDDSSFSLGMLFACAAIPSTILPLVQNKFCKDTELSCRRWMGFGYTQMAVTLWLASWAPHATIYLIFGAIFYGTNSMLYVMVTTVIQTSCSPRYIGRVLTSSFALRNILSVVGYFITGQLLMTLPRINYTGYIFSGFSTLMAAFYLFYYLPRFDRPGQRSYAEFEDS